MAAHARLKNEFTEDEKYHNLMIWHISFILFRIAWWRFRSCLVFAVFKIVCDPFAFGVWGSMWKSIRWVPGHCLFIYYASREKGQKQLMYSRFQCTETKIVRGSDYSPAIAQSEVKGKVERKKEKEIKDNNSISQVIMIH